MRRSTTKKEQASSLPQQEEGIEYIAKELWIKSSEIQSYIESRSWFENRSRKEWKKMMEEIDKQKEACIILCRDTSRLSRNPTDNLAIANRIFGDNKHRKVIHSIFYLGTGMKIEEWNDRTNKKHIVDTLHQNYTDSMENKEKCIAGVLLKLEQWEFPYCPPHGLSRVNRFWVKRTSRSEKTTLKQDHEMPFIRHAFEMKAKGKTTKDICKYLQQYGNINISPKSLVETLFANTVYKGVYTEKTTWRVFESIGFWDGKPPIDTNLWEDANGRIWKRGHGFWEWQKDHIAPGILKHESGKSLYMYKAKGKYNAYQTEIKVENGKRKSIGIMEREIIKEFLSEVIPRIRSCYNKIHRIGIATFYSEECEKIQKWEQTPQELLNRMYDDIFFKKHLYYDEGVENTIPYIIDKNTKENLTHVLWESPAVKNETEEKMKNDERKLQIEVELQRKEEETKKEKVNLTRLLGKGIIEKDIYDATIQSLSSEIDELKYELNTLSESTNMEEFINRLPEIITNLHELSSRVLTDAEYEWWRDDVKKLMQIVLHELTLTNKKELKVKLFEGLENLETDKMWNGAIDRTWTCDLLLRREAF